MNTLSNEDHNKLLGLLCVFFYLENVNCMSGLDAVLYLSKKAISLVVECSENHNRGCLASLMQIIIRGAFRISTIFQFSWLFTIPTYVNEPSCSSSDLHTCATTVHTVCSDARLCQMCCACAFSPAKCEIFHYTFSRN